MYMYNKYVSFFKEKYNQSEYSAKFNVYILEIARVPKVEKPNPPPALLGLRLI